jgi:geranylgeranyl pyrophosphate synthase
LMGIAASREYAEELIQQAQAELTVFGENANWLRQLAKIMLSRAN